MTAQLTALIDKRDTCEIVREKIGAILLEESVAQQALALADNKDPGLWKLRVYTEASNPWDAFLPADAGEVLDKSPIVNVWWDKSTDDEKASNTHERQKSTGTYNVDVYAYGESRETADGQEAGDTMAALGAQAAARLVRNILMSAHHNYLGMRGTVWRRWRESSTSFQPTEEQRPVDHVHAVRIVMRVEFNEFSPQVSGEPLETISVGVSRMSDGLLYLTATYGA